MNAQGERRFTGELESRLRCPICGSSLVKLEDAYKCESAGCGVRFPLVNSVPILINEKSSLFSISDFSVADSANAPKRNNIPRRLKKLIPSIGLVVNSKENWERFWGSLKEKRTTPRVLIVGCGELGLVDSPYPVELVSVDVSLSPDVMIVCDCHDIPFSDDTFDAVVVHAVLEHVLDPYRCVDEIHRVSNKGAVVYAATPFIQQVHGGRFDFTRFTHLGHRRLFRRFEEVDSGPIMGPGSALAWSYKYFLTSFARRKSTWKLLSAFAAFTSFYLKYFDYILAKNPGAYDAAGGYYFIGKKSGSVLSDKELIREYRGMV